MSTADGAPEAAATAEAAEAPSLWTTASPAEAIQLALSQSKLFLVWIPPSSEDSSAAWDSVWADTAVLAFLSQYGVAITLSQGSADAAMFLQLVRSAPSAVGVWIVFAGRMLDSFAEPPSPQEMLQRIQAALSSSQAPPAPAPNPLPLQGQTQPVASTSEVATQSAPTASSSPPSHPSAQTESSQSDTVREQLAARRERLKASKAQQGPHRPSPVSDVQKRKNEMPAARQQRDRPQQPTRSAKSTSPNKPKNALNDAPKGLKSCKKSKTTRRSDGAQRQDNKTLLRHRTTPPHHRNHARRGQRGMV